MKQVTKLENPEILLNLKKVVVKYKLIATWKVVLGTWEATQIFSQGKLNPLKFNKWPY